MSWPLLRKEAREHGVVLIVLATIAGLALFAMLRVADNQGGRFVGFARFLLTIGPLIALVLANRLLVREYAGRTQFFLETLPIGRARAFATKWLLGCALMLLMTWSAWAMTLRSIRRTEVLAFADATGALWSAAVLSLTVWSFASLAAMLGRYRYLAWAAVALAAMLAVDVAGVRLLDLPVVRLMGQEVQMAIGVPERATFVAALGIAGLCTAAAAALALVGSGAMASTLAQRMTARERVFALVALIAVSTIGYTLEPKPVQPPFELTRGERHLGRFTRVAVLPTGAFASDAARSLARAIAEDADTLIEALELDIEPRVFILPQQGLDRHVMQRAALSAADGIVLKVAADAPIDKVRMLVLHSLLADATLGRGMKEDRHALLDGLTTYWTLREEPAAREQWWLRAAAIVEPLPAGHLTAWAASSERLGECLSLALAFSAFDAFVADVGRDNALGSMKRLFAVPKDDVRALFEPRPAELLAEAGTDWDRLTAAAFVARERARERHAATLARRPMLDAAVDWRDEAGQGITIETRLSGAARYAAYYRSLSPWTADAGEMPRLDVRGSTAVLPLSPSRRERVLTVIEVDDEVLDCPVRVLAERLQFR